MKEEKGFQCQSCRSYLSHPLDACPVCGDQFYWLVVSDQSVSSNERIAFVDAMERLVQGNVTAEFLTYGGRLWLPYEFWTYSPDGQILESFPWIKDVELFQHEHGESVKAATRPASLDNEPIEGLVVEDEVASDPEPDTLPEPNAYDTIPRMPLPQFDAPPAAKPAPSARSQQPSPEASADEEEESRAGKGIPTHLFAPLMVLLFFVLLSMSYLVLRYHKNHMRPVIEAPIEATDSGGGIR